MTGWLAFGGVGGRGGLGVLALEEDEMAAQWDYSAERWEERTRRRTKRWWWTEEVEDSEDITVSYFLHRSYLQPQSLCLCLRLTLDFSFFRTALEKSWEALCAVDRLQFTFYAAGRYDLIQMLWNPHSQVINVSFVALGCPLEALAITSGRPWTQ